MDTDTKKLIEFAQLINSRGEIAVLYFDNGNMLGAKSVMVEPNEWPGLIVCIGADDVSFMAKCNSLTCVRSSDNLF